MGRNSSMSDERSANPFLEESTAALRALLFRSIARGDHETFSFASLEAARRRDIAAEELLRAELAAAESGMAPVPWLEAACAIARRFTALTRRRGGAHVYAVLLRPLDGPAGRWGVYVGETALDPACRLSKHLAGAKASRHVSGRGVCLLPAIYRHLNPLSRSEAREVEGKLAAAFARHGIETRGGH